MDKEGFRDVDELTVGLSKGYELVSVDEPVKEAKQGDVVGKKAVPVKRKAVKKKKVKKASKPARKSPGKKKGKKVNWVPVTIGVLVVVVIGVLAYLYFSVGAPSEADRLAAMVNDDPIYVSDLQSRHNFLSHTVNPLITEEETLNQMIEEKLLVQHARLHGYSVSREEVEEDMDFLLAENNLQKGELLENLDLMGVNYEEFVRFNRDRLLITKLVDGELRGLSEPADEDVRAYYDAFPEQFGSPDRVQVRHILIGFEGRTDEEAFGEAERVMGLIGGDRENFCELVMEYTDDVASAGSCGEYNFSLQDPLVPEFLDAGFDMVPGELRNVGTQFGYHVMYKVSDIEGDIVSFEEVEADLADFVAQQMLIGEYQDLVAELRRGSIIEVYSEDREILAGNSGVVPVREVENTDEAGRMNLARCLGDLDAMLFKVYWCPDCDEQVEMFGEHIRFVDVVECDPGREDARVGLCEEHSITSYPTWVIGGEEHIGMRTLNALASISGCEY